MQKDRSLREQTRETRVLAQEPGREWAEALDQIAGWRIKNHLFSRIASTGETPVSRCCPVTRTSRPCWRSSTSDHSLHRQQMPYNASAQRCQVVPAFQDADDSAGAVLIRDGHQAARDLLET